MLFADRRRPSRKALLFFFCFKAPQRLYRIHSNHGHAWIYQLLEGWNRFSHHLPQSLGILWNHPSVCVLWVSSPSHRTAQCRTAASRPSQDVSHACAVTTRFSSLETPVWNVALQEAAHGGLMKLALSELNRPARRSCGSCKPPPERKRWLSMQTLTNKCRTPRRHTQVDFY